MTVPNRNNFCGGAFDDWLEVLLTPDCQGHCEWCIERPGYHPKHRASVEELIEQIHADDATNVILLGGEPTLYPHLQELLDGISDTRNVYITTNGGLLSEEFVANNLQGITGVNISIHHYDLKRNKRIVGVDIDEQTLEKSIVELRRMGATVRFNCNIIKGEIDSRLNIFQYVLWAKKRGADRVRFAELKLSRKFVSLHEILGSDYGLSEQPYIYGCNHDGVLGGMPVNFRQMCGLQTPYREKPSNPHVVNQKDILYYDGMYYKGWQDNRRKHAKEIEGTYCR